MNRDHTHELSLSRPPSRSATDSLIDPVSNPMACVTGIGLGYLYSAAMRAVVELRIPDLLADGPRTADELAAITATSSSHLRRVLRALAGCGLFVQSQSGRFGLTATGALLCTSHESSLRDAVLMMTSDPFLEAGIHLLDALRSGGNAFEVLRGLSFFEYLCQTPTAAQIFHAGMANFATTENAPIAATYDFSPFSRVIDVGGGYGGFLRQILVRHPHLHGVLYDTPDVVRDQRHLQLHDVSDRVTVVGGDFFTSIPSGADVCIVKRVLHDWSDQDCRRILRRCREAIDADGRILIIDALVQEDNQPSLVNGVDLLMLAASDGHERNDREFATLLASAGLALHRVIPTPSMLSIIEAVPTGDSRSALSMDTASDQRRES